MLTSTALLERQTRLDFHTKMQNVNDEDRKVGKAECCDSGVENEKLLTYTIRSHEHNCFDWRGEKEKTGEKKHTKSKPLNQATKKKRKERGEKKQNKTTRNAEQQK